MRYKVWFKDPVNLGFKLDALSLSRFLRNYSRQYESGIVDIPLGDSETGYDGPTYTKIKSDLAGIGGVLMPVRALTPLETREVRVALTEMKRRKHNSMWLNDTFFSIGCLWQPSEMARQIAKNLPGYHTCSMTDTVYHESKMVIHEGAYIERVYFETNFHACAGCGRRSRNHLALYTQPDEDGDRLRVLKCRDCAGDVDRCDRCGNVGAKTDMKTVDCDKVWCSSCVDADTRFCKVCKGFVTRCLCQNERIFNHSFKPAPRWRHLDNEKDRHYIGLEIEIEKPSFEHLGVSEIGYYKRDGSIGDRGENAAEFVSHPFTYEYYKAKGRDILKDLLEQHIKAGGRSYQTDTCGTHVHISRSILSGDVHLNKLLEFSHNNADLFMLLSRRRKKQLLDRWANSRFNISRAALVKNKGMGVAKYQAINVLPKNTIEFRIFRGTLDIEGIDLYLQTVFSMIEFTRWAGFGELNEQRYLDYVRKNRTTYPRLDEFLSVKGKLPALLQVKKTEVAVCIKIPTGQFITRVVKKFEKVPLQTKLQEI